jgi:S1-C subfamily serine protease
MRTWKLVVYPAVIAAAVLFSAACGGSGEKAKPTEGPNPPQSPVETAGPLDVERLAESVVMVAPGVRSGRDFEPVATGSGTIVDESGLILTNFHVVDPDNVGAYEDIAIYVSNDPEDVPDLTYFGGLAAWDEELDLAVIRITSNRNGIDIDPEALDLKTVKIGDLKDLGIGDELTVLGYPAVGEGSLELTKGSVSGFVVSEGQKQAWIKTDARIAAGNSGGGAFDERGELVGVPSAVYYVDEFAAEGSGRIRPIDLALGLVDEAKATTEVVIPRPGQAPEGSYEGEIPLFTASDIGPDFVLSDETYLSNEDRAVWYDNPDEAVDFYESYGRLGGLRRIFDNVDAAKRSGESPVFIVAQIDVYETEQGAAGASSDCQESVDTIWEFVSALGFEFYEPEYMLDPMLGNESCLFSAEEIVSSPSEPPLLLAFAGFRQGNVLAVVGALTFEDAMSYEGLGYLAGYQSNLLTSELGLVVPPRGSNAAPPSLPTAVPQPPRQQPNVPPAPAQPLGYSTPEEAIGVYLASYEVGYVGDCAWADLNTDVGYYCSLLYEDRVVERLYLVGLTFSEAEAWVLVERYNDGSWVAIDDMAVEYDEWGYLIPTPW